MAYVKSLQIMVFEFQSDLVGRSADNSQFAYCLDVGQVFIYNGTVWMPSSKTQVKKSTVVVDGKSTGNTKVYTTEGSSLNFYPIMVVFRAVNIAGVTLQPTVSVGTNSSNYNNISSASLLTTALSALSAGSGSPQNAAISTPIPGNTDIYARVSIAGIATSYTFNVEVIGFYDN